MINRRIAEPYTNGFGASGNLLAIRPERLAGTPRLGETAKSFLHDDLDVVGDAFLIGAGIAAGGAAKGWWGLLWYAGAIYGGLRLMSHWAVESDVLAITGLAGLATALGATLYKLERTRPRAVAQSR